MNLRRVLVSFLAVALVFYSSGVYARNMRGKFGLGYRQTLLGVEGFGITYWTSPKIALIVTGGVRFELDENNNNTTTILGSIGVKYVFLSRKYVNFSVGISGDIGWLSQVEREGEALGSLTQVGVEVPLEAEYFLSDSFSIEVAAGFTFTVVPSKSGEDIGCTGEAFYCNGPLLRAAGLGYVSQPEHKVLGIGAGAGFAFAGFTVYF